MDDATTRRHRHSRDAFALDQEAARINAAPLKVSAHALTALLVLGVSLTPQGLALLGVHPLYLTVFTLLFVLDHVEAAARIRDGTMFEERNAVRRFLAFLVPMLFTACFAASSSVEATPTWAFLAMGGVARGLMGYSVNRAFLATVVGSGLGFHLLTAPRWTPLSVAAATLASVFACLAGVLGERMIRHALDLEARAKSADDLAQEARGEARRLAAAMSLHDGLSGVVFGVRAKLESTTETAGVSSAVRTLVLRARELLVPFGASLDLERALRELASLYDVPITMEGQLASDLRRLEARDLAFAAIEMTTNALRHHRPRRVVVRLSSSPHRVVEVVSMEGSSTPPLERGAGRGSRHLALRATAWGGTYAQWHEGTSSCARIDWAPSAERRGPGWLAIATPLSASLFFAVLWLGDPNPWSMGFVVVCVALSAAMVGLGARSLKSTEARIERSEGEREQAQDETSALAHSAKLDEALEALSGALETEDREALRARLVAFTEALQSFMSAIENAPAPHPSAPVRTHGGHAP